MKEGRGDMQPKKSLQILSTRKLQDETLGLMYESGIAVQELSFIEIKYTVERAELASLLATVLSNVSPALFIFSSKHTVIGFSKLIEQDEVQWPSGLHAACVGTNTAKLAKDHLKTDIVLVANSAAELAPLIIAETSLDTNIIYCCGNLRRDVLPESLLNAGFKLKEVEIYETLLTPHKVYDYHDAILFFSPSAVESYLQVNEWQPGVVGVAIGSTTANALEEAGIKDILISKAPDESNMAEAVLTYFNHNIL